MTKITNATHWVWFKDLHPFTNPIWVRFRANYQMEKILAQEKLFSHKLFMSHDANCRWDLYPSLCHRTHGAAIFPLIFSLKITCLFEPFAKELQLINWHRRDQVSCYFANHLQPIVKLREQIWFWKVCLPLYSPDNRLSLNRFSCSVD